MEKTGAVLLLLLANRFRVCLMLCLSFCYRTIRRSQTTIGVNNKDEKRQRDFHDSRDDDSDGDGDGDGNEVGMMVETFVCLLWFLLSSSYGSTPNLPE